MSLSMRTRSPEYGSVFCSSAHDVMCNSWRHSCRHPRNKFEVGCPAGACIIKRCVLFTLRYYVFLLKTRSISIIVRNICCARSFEECVGITVYRRCETLMGCSYLNNVIVMWDWRNVIKAVYLMLFQKLLSCNGQNSYETFYS